MAFTVTWSKTQLYTCEWSNLSSFFHLCTLYHKYNGRLTCWLHVSIHDGNFTRSDLGILLDNFPHGKRWLKSVRLMYMLKEHREKIKAVTASYEQHWLNYISHLSPHSIKRTFSITSSLTDKKKKRSVIIVIRPAVELKFWLINKYPANRN